MTAVKAQTPHHACSLAWCPEQPELLAVANYEMRDEKRYGSVLLYRIHKEEICPLIASADLGGVYDLTWLNDSLCVCVTAKGQVVALADELVIKTASEATNEIYTCLHSCSHDTVVSTDHGKIRRFQFDDASIRQSSSWLAHSYFDGSPAEVWCLRQKNSLILSGGDDCYLRTWDRRTSSGVLALGNVHDAGVTAVNFVDETNDYLILTGSYDHQARLFDLRKPLRPLAAIDLGAGVWRFHSGPTPNTFILPCTQAGVIVLRIDQLATVFTKLFQYTGHDPNAITYGAAVSPAHNSLAASCSFYDNNIHLWHLPPSL